MRLARFVAPGEETPRAGNVEGERVTSFEPGVTVEELVKTGARPPAAGDTFALEDVRLLAPYRPRAIFAVGLNYALHAAEGGVEVPERPMIFMKGPASATGPCGPVIRPAGIEKLDYEAELAVVVGPERSVAGYAIANDVSARDLIEPQLTRQKAGDTFCPWGPWVTTAEDVPDPRNLRIRTWVDDELRQDGNTRDMIFDPHEILDTIASTIEPLAGDVVITGTPDGVGWATQRFLDPGARVRIEIEGLGAIEHEIHEARS